MGDSAPTIEDGRTRRARQRRTVRRQQIMDAALDVFASKGYHATAVSDVQRAAGVARGTFYLYFESKHALFEQVLDAVLTEIRERIHRVRLGADAPAPLDQLRANLVRLLKLARSRPALLQVALWEAVGLDAELDEKLHAFHERIYALTQRSLDAGLGLGLVRPCDTGLAARCLVGQVKEVLVAMRLRQDSAHDDDEALATQLLEFAARGILTAAID